jgi:L-asparaginase/Glu-tRNA(Gln) amidotransferase subunit D
MPTSSSSTSADAADTTTRFREVMVPGRKTRRLKHGTLYYAEQAGDDRISDLERAMLAKPRDLTARDLDVEVNAAKRFRKKVLVIYNGGTIGMAPDPNHGGELAPMKGYLTHQMLTMSDLEHPSVPFFDVLEYDDLVDSSDAGVGDWTVLAHDIRDWYYTYDAFVIAHGTDTMHYSACALSFALRNLAKPVILTGSMVPLQEIYNDARRNLKMSLLFAGHTQVCEVCICFNDVLLRGNRSVKVSDSVWAFESPNLPPLAAITSSGISLSRHLLLRQPRGALKVHASFASHVMCLTVTPGDCLNGALSLFRRVDSPPGPVSCNPAPTGTTAAVPQPGGSVAVGIPAPTTSKSSSKDFAALGDLTSADPGESFEADALSHGHADDPEAIARAAALAAASSSPRSPAVDVSTTATDEYPVKVLVLRVNGDTSGSAFPALPALQRLAEAVDAAGSLVVLVSATPHGGFTPMATAHVRRLAPQIVVLGDMTAEAATVKAMYLLSWVPSMKRLATLMAADLRGEVTSPDRLAHL